MHKDPTVTRSIVAQLSRPSQNITEATPKKTLAILACAEQQHALYKNFSAVKITPVKVDPVDTVLKDLKEKQYMLSILVQK